VVLSPLLFLIVAEGLNRALKEAMRTRNFKGIKIGISCYSSHLLFIDDSLIFCDGIRKDVIRLKEIIDLYHIATGKHINIEKYSISFVGLSNVDRVYISQFFPYHHIEIEGGLEQLGFILKPNDYLKSDWIWLILKVEID
jgi:hypothetical protein